MKVKIDKMKDKIFELEMEAIALKYALENEKRRSAEEIDNSYSHQVEVFNENEEIEFVVVTFRATKDLSDLRRLHNDLFETNKSLPEKVRISSEYYRKYGVIFSRSTGFALLKENVLCSDEEWEEIKNNNIKKFINN